MAHVVFLLDRAGVEHLESLAQIVLSWAKQHPEFINMNNSGVNNVDHSGFVGMDSQGGWEEWRGRGCIRGGGEGRGGDDLRRGQEGRSHRVWQALVRSVYFP